MSIIQTYMYTVELSTYLNIYICEYTYVDANIHTALVWRCLFCSGLPPRFLLSHLRHQRVQFPSINGTGGVLFVSLPVLNVARLVHSRCLAPLFGMGFHWRLLLRVHSDAFYSSLKTALFSHARVGSSSEYSNLEEAPYKST